MAICPSTKLLIALDITLGFPNKQNSRVSFVRRGIDPKTGEQVIQLEYRVLVNKDVAPINKPKKMDDQQSMSLLRSLMDKNQ